MKDLDNYATSLDKPHGQCEADPVIAGDGCPDGGLPNKQCINSNNQPRKAHLTDKLKVIFSSIVKELTTSSIQPHYDQLVFSLHSTLPVQEVKQSFAVVFGEPGESFDHKFWLFQTSIGQLEISRKRENTKFHHIIKLRNLQILRVFTERYI